MVWMLAGTWDRTDRVRGIRASIIRDGRGRPRLAGVRGLVREQCPNILSAFIPFILVNAGSDSASLLSTTRITSACPR